MVRILLAEDDRLLSDGVAMALRQSGYTVEQILSGSEADQAVRSSNFDLMILDLGLPEMDGTEVLSRLRQRKQNLPVLVLTARDSLEDRVTGLDLGANDYLIKPFDLPELEARIRALTRRDSWDNQTYIENGPLKYDVGGKVLSINGEAVSLSARELAVLELLLQKLGRVVNKNQIVDALSDWDSEVTFNAVEIIMHRLRKKIESSDCKIKTVRGLGYMMDRL